MSKKVWWLCGAAAMGAVLSTTLWQDTKRVSEANVNRFNPAYAPMDRAYYQWNGYYRVAPNAPLPQYSQKTN